MSCSRNGCQRIKPVMCAVHIPVYAADIFVIYLNTKLFAIVRAISDYDRQLMRLAVRSNKVIRSRLRGGRG